MKRSGISILLIALLVCSACTDTATTEPDMSAVFASGMELLSGGGEANLREAINVFSSCVELAPDYAPCHAGLARTYASISGNYNIMSPDEAWPTARRAAEKAVELGGDLAVAHLALAEVIAGQDWDWASAERHYQHAVALDSTDLETLISHAWFLYCIGRHDESSATVVRLRELDPEYSDPNLEHLLTGDSGRAKEESAALIGSDPENPGGYWISANIHAREGEYEQAAEHLLNQIPLMDGDVVDEVALLGHVYARMGRTEEARQMLERLDELSREGRYVSPANRAWIHAGLGEVDETLDLLRQGIETRANRCGLDMKGFAYVFEPLSGDVRFGELLEEIGLSE
jgi:tetratricopeptide (TPR) repeat protein